MPDYPYLATVIVPVYNVEKFVDNAILSLLNQTIDQSKMQILLINDGSTDNSKSICEKYAEDYDNIFLYSKENQGLSNTRNFGLTKAEGKYIFYLDSDDTFSENTVEEVTSFFEKVYDEVDLVAYRIIQYYNGKPKLIHFRYRTLKESGIYDLNKPENCYVSQTTVNVCIKNMGESNINFDETPNFRHEDEKYNCDIVANKMKIGFCNKGEYRYNRNNENSIVSSLYTPENIFEESTTYYENLFNKYKLVPKYFQAIVFNDFRWIMKENLFLPLHLEGDEWFNANKRIDALLDRIDEDIIILHPSVDENHMHYWLKRRSSSHPIVVTNENEIKIIVGSRCLYSTKKLNLSGTDILTIKSPIFFHLKRSQFEIFAKIGSNNIKLKFNFNDDYLDKSNDTVEKFFPTFPKRENADYYIKINGIKYDLQ